MPSGSTRTQSAIIAPKAGWSSANAMGVTRSASWAPRAGRP